MAIACLRLFTFLPERPLFSVPRLRSCIARFTLDCAFLPYLLAMASPCVLRKRSDSTPRAAFRVAGTIRCRRRNRDEQPLTATKEETMDKTACIGAAALAIAAAGCAGVQT